MGNFINDQITKFLNQKMQGVGQIDNLQIEDNAIKVTIALNGEPEPVQLEILGISWSTSSGTLHIYFESARASKVWLQALLNIAAEKTGKRLSIPDKFSLAPIKMMFRRA